MSREMLNDQTWSSQEVRSAFAPGRASMSYGGVAVKTGLFLVVIAALAAVGWVTSETFTGRGSGLVYLVGFIVLIGLSIAAVHNPRLALLAGLLYAVLNGLWIGAISRYYDEVFDGIVGVALLGTLAVCVGVLLLFSVAGFRVTARGAQIIAVLVVGIGLLYLFGWIFSLVGVDLDFLYGSSPAAIVIGLILSRCSGVDAPGGPDLCGAGSGKRYVVLIAADVRVPAMVLWIPPVGPATLDIVISVE
jgi:uncharacterized YccA/Bax inhibitor family protein